MSELDIAKNRAGTKWSRAEQIRRVLWALVLPAFRIVPRPFWGWRRFLLRSFGARIGQQVHVYPSVRITMPWNLTIDDNAAVGDGAILYALGPIHIGARATVSQGAHLCAGSHDIALPDRPLVKPPIEVGADAWVAADAFIGPGVTVGPRAIVGARAVAMKDVPPCTIVVGNPAKPLRTLTEDATA
ncbi:acetyltransferase [Mameliella alba]|uniref:acetyltransferase n=1 Tax=Mameliella alba TaxID=561184 RepID=UPI000B53110C|nr:acetyltransferase [Mameliella alba]MBY6117567.1 acetyltransferase [Mameliella alba]OWV64961.1 acetyltransferase [Mameliella alba]